MSIFTNIHNMAASMIPRTRISYMKSEGSTISDSGIRTAKYSAPKTLLAHVQPGLVSSFGNKALSESEYGEMGLDFSRKHITLWCDNIDVNTVSDAEFPDRFIIDGSAYNAIKISDWLGFSGWKQIFCVEEKQ